MTQKITNLIMNVLDHLEKFHETEGDFLELASTLNELKNDDLTAFAQLYGSPRLGRRKAYYLVSIDNTFSKFPTLRPRLIAIGWTKLGLIAHAVNGANIDDMLDFAEAHTTKELELAFKKDGKGKAVSPVKLMFSPEQFAVFVKVIEAHGATPSFAGYVNVEDAVIAAMKKLAA